MIWALWKVEKISGHLCERKQQQQKVKERSWFESDQSKYLRSRQKERATGMLTASKSLLWTCFWSLRALLEWATTGACGASECLQSQLPHSAGRSQWVGIGAQSAHLLQRRWSALWTRCWGVFLACLDTAKQTPRIAGWWRAGGHGSRKNEVNQNFFS